MRAMLRSIRLDGSTLAPLLEGSVGNLLPLGVDRTVEQGKLIDPSAYDLITQGPCSVCGAIAPGRLTVCHACWAQRASSCTSAAPFASPSSPRPYAAN